MQLAPVIVQVYTRKDHFINCIESLSKCKLADQTRLFIASDAPKTSADEEIIKEIRDYCATIVGFKRIDLLVSEKNLGAIETYQNAFAKVFSEYDKLIFSEDDNVFAPNFLEFINEGLEFYKENPHIFAICGYKHPFKIPKRYSSTIFSSTVIAPWGFGVWKKKYEVVNLFPNDYFEYKNKKRMSNVWRLIIESVGTTNVYGDALLEYHCLKNDMVNIFPHISLVRNYGSDGSGTHLRICKEYGTQEISNGKDNFIFLNDIKIDEEIEKRLIESIDYPFQKGIVLQLLKIKMKIKLPMRRFVLNRPKLKRIVYWILKK
jgi:hypothetical protein